MSLLPNALVVLFDGRRAYWGYTDETGKVILSGVPAGNYKLAIIKEEYLGYVGDVVVDEDESISVTLTKPTGAIELRDGVALSVSEMTIRNMIMEVFDTRAIRDPEFHFRLTKMFYNQEVTPHILMTLQGKNQVIKFEVEHEVEEILKAESPKVKLEVENG